MSAAAFAASAPAPARVEAPSPDGALDPDRNADGAQDMSAQSARRSLDQLRDIILDPDEGPRW